MIETLLFGSILHLFHAEARMYDAKHRQWMSSDPIKDGLNWYQYVGGNPATWWDATGLIIQLSGTTAERKALLGYLQQLTDHKLGMYDDGTVYIAKPADRIKYPAGNALLESLMDNTQHTASIRFYTQADFDKWGIYGSYNLADSSDASNVGIGSGSTVVLNPNWRGDFPTVLNDSDIVPSNSWPFYVIVAHELIHAERAMRGTRVYSKKETGEGYDYYTFTVAKYIYAEYNFAIIICKVERYSITEFRSIEEYETVGLGKYSNKNFIDDILVTENTIREEHNKLLRGGYWWD